VRVSGKIETGLELKKQEKRSSGKKKLRRACWSFGISAGVLVVFILLLLYEPRGYGGGEKAGKKEVSTYLTHELSPRLYEGAQRQEPFELVVLAEGVNEAIADLGWPKESQGVKFSVPEVFFWPGRAVLIGATEMRGVEFVVSVVFEPAIDGAGLLNLHVSKIKVGAVNVTPIAKLMAKRMYLEQFGGVGGAVNVGGQAVESLIYDRGFEPVFEVEDKKVRIEGVTINEGKLLLRFLPVVEDDF
jgi:hypothetical protein